MRKRYLFTLAAGQAWPDSVQGEGGVRARFDWVLVENRGAAGSSTVLAFLHRRPATAAAVDPLDYDRLIEGGRRRVWNVSDADDEKPQQLHIINVGTTPAPLLVEVSDRPIVDLVNTIPLDASPAAIYAAADGAAAAGIPESVPGVYNGATVDRERAGSAANLAAFSALGSGLTATPGEWTIASNPAAGAQATATRAAGAAGVRHVCRSVAFTAAASSAAPGNNALTVVVRDGAAGVGTPLFLAVIGLQSLIGANGQLVLSDLNIVGSAATAMTIEFTGGFANTYEAVTLSGYDAF